MEATGSRLSSLPEVAAARLVLALLVVCLTALACRPASGPERASGPVTPVAVPTPATVSTATPSAVAVGAEPDALDKAEVIIGGVSFDAELAIEPSERARGLSGRASLLPKTGMLFVFEGPTMSRFWMKEMRFPLDFVWIGEDCTVVDITIEVPAPDPGTALADLPRYSPSSPAAYNLEINAGEVDKYGLAVGSSVRFRGMPAGVEPPCGG